MLKMERSIILDCLIRNLQICMFIQELEWVRERNVENEKLIYFGTWMLGMLNKFIKSQKCWEWEINLLGNRNAENDELIY